MTDFQFAILENITTVIATASVVLGLYAMGAGYMSLFGFAILLNLNTAIQVKPPVDKK